MSGHASETHQEATVQGRGEEEEGGGAAQVEEDDDDDDDKEQAEGDEEADGPAGPGEDDQIIRHGQQQQQGPPQEAARWYKKKIRNAKGLFLLPFRKIKRLYVRRFRSAYYYYGDDPGGCCCRCLRPPPAISPPRLPNSGNPGRKNPNPSSYEFVKYLIESNDFYAPQCNSHGGSSRCPDKAGDDGE